jgi:LuxR family maltose regulon positive regulatory protein
MELAIAVAIPAIIRVELLLAEGSPVALDAAAQEVAQLTLDYTARRDTIHEVPLLVLQALVAEARGDGERALASLACAVERGKPGGFVRTFVDRGAALAPLLARLRPPGENQDYVARLLASCAARQKAPPPPVPQREAMWAELTEPLTAREMEVLELLARRFSNKEVADTLCVSWHTVAKHANNIFQKLRVKGRRDAVRRAEELGILSNETARVVGE